MLNTYIALLICFVVGTKLMFIYRDLTVKTLDATKGLKISCDFKHTKLTEKQLAELVSDVVRSYYYFCMRSTMRGMYACMPCTIFQLKLAHTTASLHCYDHDVVTCDLVNLVPTVSVLRVQFGICVQRRWVCWHNANVTQVDDYSIYDHIEAGFWFRKILEDKSPQFILSLIRLVMFQNSLVLAQFIFYLWQIGEEVRACGVYVRMYCRSQSYAYMGYFAFQLHDVFILWCNE